jgi:KDO2-lipid IV(A) lauroyltransferase
VPDQELFRAALAEGRGLVIPTAHFGGWEVGARFLSDLGRPVNLVTAHEPNPTARDFIHHLRSRHGVNVIYSDRSVFAGLPVLQALRRHEVVGMQIDPWGRPQGGQAIDFCGGPARFQAGPFAIARVARAPLIPVFAVRTGLRRYEMRTPGPVRSTHSGRQRRRVHRHGARLRAPRPRVPGAVADVWREPPVQTVGARASRPELGRRSALAGILRSNARAMLRRPS